MNCKYCKKLIATGAISTSLVMISPLCHEKCHAVQAQDLPSGNEPSSRSYSFVNRAIVFSLSSSTMAGVYFNGNIDELLKNSERLEG